MGSIAVQSLNFRDLGLMGYREAWSLQEEAHAAVLAGGSETVFLVEHPPVVTLGRRDDCLRNLLTPPEELARQNVDLVQSDRGGDITYHAPGQIVVYPIIRLKDHGLSVSGYVHLLESIVIAALGEMEIAARADSAAVGVWAESGKICAIGVRIRRGVTLHGLALNITTDLDGFRHIVPCGLQGRRVTSIQELLGANVPEFDRVKQILMKHISRAFVATSDPSCPF